MTEPALQGLRILDLTQVAVGPYATLLLGFMGAEVIKVESLARMDISRGQARPTPGPHRVYPGDEPGERPWNRSGHHVQRSANKMSLTLDLATPRGKELLLSLVTVCDALFENFRASVMDRLGLGYDVVSAANPQLIYLKISSQGATGPEKDYGSLGSTLEQTGGLASVTGYGDGVPLTTNATYPDPVAGILAVGALMASLRRRRRTGKGTFVDFSQREVAISLLGEAVLDYSLSGRVAAARGNRDAFMAPQGVYRCRGDDAWVAVSVGSDEEWGDLCRAIGQPRLSQDPRFETAEARRRNHDEMDRVLASWTQSRDHYEAMHALQAQGVPAGAVLKGGEIIADPHLEARGFWDTVEHPEAGTYRQVTTPWRLSKNPRKKSAPAPGLGEHNAYVLGELLGVATRDLEELEAQGIIGTRPLAAD